MSQYHQQSDECDVLKAPWLHGAHEVIMSTQISLRPKASRGQLFELLVGSETRRRVDKPSVASESQRTEQDFEAVELTKKQVTAGVSALNAFENLCVEIIK